MFSVSVETARRDVGPETGELQATLLAATTGNEAVEALSHWPHTDHGSEFQHDPIHRGCFENRTSVSGPTLFCHPCHRIFSMESFKKCFKLG